MTFTEYLQQKKYSQRTIETYLRYIERFLTWLSNESLGPGSFTYNDLLEFMRCCQTRGVTKRTVHGVLCVIRHWCNYQIAQGSRTDNPAAGVFIRGLIRKLPANLIGMEELEELYKQYSIQLSASLSKKIMFGLIVYQGLDVGSLMRIEMKDIKLKEGKIKIRAARRTNERLLSLNANQVIMLQQYVNENKFKEAAVFHNRIQHMLRQLRQLNSKVINAGQIRSSVITHWLRQHNLRQVQYMAGHKYVSSTQRYQLNNLDDLKTAVQQHHPMS